MNFNFKLTGGALTLDDSRLKPLALTPERVTIKGPVNAQGRGRVALTIGSVTVTATTDANGQASFGLSQIRQSLELDRWSVANKAFSCIGHIDRGNGATGRSSSPTPNTARWTCVRRASTATTPSSSTPTTSPSTKPRRHSRCPARPARSSSLRWAGGTSVTLTLGSDWQLNLRTQQSDRIVIDPNPARRPSQLHRQVTTLNLGDIIVPSTRRTYKAFGNLSEELDDRGLHAVSRETVLIALEPLSQPSRAADATESRPMWRTAAGSTTLTRRWHSMRKPSG